MRNAFKVFNYSTDLDKNVFAYNAVIAGFVGNGLSLDSFLVYKRMRHLGVTSDKYTFSCVIRACVEDLEVFEELPLRDLVLWNSMLNGYVFGGDFEYVPKYAVLDEPTAVAQRRRNILHTRGRCRLLVLLLMV
ncbi:hypothetical protein HN51_040828 [Arachis hypogaea]